MEYAGSSGKLKAFCSLVSQGAAIIKSKSPSGGSLGASFEELNGFWRSWSDASHMPDDGSCSVGAVLLDEAMKPIAAFSEQAAPAAGSGRQGAMYAELLALERALMMALDAGARKLEARFDCLPLARSAAQALLSQPEDLDPGLAPLAEAMSRFECLALRWIPRSSNQLADALSKRPLGGGMFHGGPSQSSMIDRGWLNPEARLQPGSSEPKRAMPRESRRLAESKDFAKLDAQGPLRMAAGACWMPSSGCWMAAVAACDPHGGRNAMIEPSALWTLGRSSDPGPSGLSQALSQALAAKCAMAAAARRSSRLEKAVLYLPEPAMKQLSSGGFLDSFADYGAGMLSALCSGAGFEMKELGSDGQVAQRRAAHLGNRWELERAAGYKELGSRRPRRGA